MLLRQPLLRIAQISSQQSRIFLLRQGLQRRFASGGEPPLTGPADNAFNRERRAAKAHAAKTSDTWRKLSIYVAIPCILLAGANAWVLWNEHWEHWSHLPPLEERPQYDYLNIRNRAFPWGDGDKTAFWNPKVNYHRKPGT